MNRKELKLFFNNVTARKVDQFIEEYGINMRYSSKVGGLDLVWLHTRNGFKHFNKDMQPMVNNDLYPLICRLLSKEIFTDVEKPANVDSLIPEAEAIEIYYVTCGNEMDTHFQEKMKLVTSQAFLDKYAHLFHICDDCGAYTAVAYEHEGKHYCCSCSESHDYYYCSHDNTFRLKDEVVPIHCYYKYDELSEYVSKEKFETGNYCTDEMSGYHYTRLTCLNRYGGKLIHNQNFNENYFLSGLSRTVYPKDKKVAYYDHINDPKYATREELEASGKYVFFNDAYYLRTNVIEFDGQLYAKNHFKNQISNYHRWDGQLEFKKLEDENTEMYFGTEVETEGNQDNAYYVLHKHPDLFHCEFDGSLNCGFEIISQPMTYNYVVSKYDEIASMFKDLTDHGQKSHNTTTCGLHIHVSRKAFKDENAIERANAIINYFRSNIEILARRKNNSYCQFINVEGKIVTKEKVALSSDRYNAINNRNKNTVEFRVFKGTLNPNTYFASIELVKNIVEAANSDAKLISFESLLKGKYLPAYVEERKSRGNEFKMTTLDLQGWNQNELKSELKKKWSLIKSIKEYNLAHPNMPIRQQAIFGA